MAGEQVVEDLILAIEAMGLPEAAAAVDGLTASMDRLAVATERADGAAVGGAAGSGKKGLMGAMGGMKALLAGLGIVEAVKSFSNFQSQMERLRTQTGATQAEVGKMSKGILGMAVSVGTGPQSLAAAMYHIQSAGFRGKEALDALKVSAMGAQIGGADLTDTTTAMTAVMVAGFRGVHTLRQAMGELNATVGAGDMTMQDLNEALGTGILGTVKQLGVQVRDTGAALAVLGDNNIRGAAAANRLRMGLMTLAKPSNEAADAMKKLGLQPLELAETLRKPDGLLKMLELLKSHLKGMSPTQQTETLANIFGGGRNSAAMLILINQMSRLQTKYKEVGKGGKDFGADWQATTKNLRFFIDQVKALVEVWLIKLGAGLNSAVGWIKDKLIPAFQHGKTWAVALIAVLAGFGVLLTVAAAVALVTAAFAALGAVAEALMLTNPLGWVIIGIGALVLLIVKVKSFRQAFVDAFHWVVQAGKDAFNWIKDHWKLLAAILFGPIGLAVDFIVTHFHKIEAVGKWLFDHLKGIFSAIFNVMVWPYKEWWKIVKGIAVEIVHAFVWVVEQVEHLLSKILGPIKSVAGFIGKVGGGILHGAGGVAHSLFGLAGGTPAVTSSGAFMVGEHGPEIVYLPRGAAVQPNHELGGQPGGGEPKVLEATLPIYIDGRLVSKSVVRVGLMAQSCR